MAVVADLEVAEVANLDVAVLMLPLPALVQPGLGLTGGTSPGSDKPPTLKGLAAVKATERRWTAMRKFDRNSGSRFPERD